MSTSAWPCNGDYLLRTHLHSYGEPRGDEMQLHLSDLTACDYATKLRLMDSPQIPKSKSTRGAFAIGHFAEAGLARMFDPLVADGWTLTHGRAVSYRHVVGHIDYDLERDGMRFVVDITTTKARSTEYKMSHALKSAGYALAIDAPMFAEVVLSLGFGAINDAAWHWFRTEDYAPKINAGIDRLLALQASPDMPPMEPPPGEEWRCRAYCDALCMRNEKLALTEIPL